jgi:hypothetical protein
MSITLAWLAALGTVAVLVMYELFLATTQRRHAERLARSERWASGMVRGDLQHLARDPGRRCCALPMSASMTASTAALRADGVGDAGRASLDASFGQIRRPAGPVAVWCSNWC